MGVRLIGGGYMNKLFEILKLIKFEYLLIMTILFVLTSVMFVNMEMSDSSQMALTSITSLLSGVTGFLWGVTQTEQKK